MRTYVLDERGEPVAEGDFGVWALWFSSEQRHVGDDDVGVARVSAVFLGIDTGIGDRPPRRWETMVFGGKLDQVQERCAGSREQAEAMHVAMVARVRMAEGMDQEAVHRASE